MGSEGLPEFFDENDYGNRNYSDSTARRIDIEKRRLINEGSERARELVIKHYDKIQA